MNTSDLVKFGFLIFDGNDAPPKALKYYGLPNVLNNIEDEISSRF